MKKRVFPVRIIAVVLILCILALFLLSGRPVGSVTIEVGETVGVSDFFSGRSGLFFRMETDVSGLDLTVPGTHQVTLRRFGRRYVRTLNVVDTVSPTGQLQDLTAFYTHIPKAEEFVVSVEDATAVTVSYLIPPDASIEGEQTVTILLTDLGGNVTALDAVLTLYQDQDPPVISGAEDIRVYLGETPDLLAGVSVSDNKDPSPVLTVEQEGLDLTQLGAYPITYRACDSCGNTTELTVTVSVLQDAEPPQILGVTELSMYLGGTIAYRSGIIVTDDTDLSPTLSVDSSAVDLSTPGTYPVVYTATDCLGNSTVRQTTITVSEAPSGYVDEDVIRAEADKLLDAIVTDGMTTEEQINAIYDYMESHYYYVNNSDKTDWMQAAYQLTQTQRGDCFSFFALSRLFFDRLGIPNLSVTRMANTTRTTSHYWSMVSLDGGETWYHYDSTPHLTTPTRTCLVTDAFLEAFNEGIPYYYYWDRDAYPATPEA